MTLLTCWTIQLESEVFLVIVIFVGTKEEIKEHKMKDNFDCFFHNVNCQNRYCDQCKICHDIKTHYIEVN